MQQQGSTKGQAAVGGWAAVRQWHTSLTAPKPAASKSHLTRSPRRPSQARRAAWPLGCPGNGQAAGCLKIPQEKPLEARS